MIERTLRVLPWVTTRDHAVRMAGNRKACSCWMCGNARKHHGAPFYEIRNKVLDFD